MGNQTMKRKFKISLQQVVVIVTDLDNNTHRRIEAPTVELAKDIAVHSLKQKVAMEETTPPVCPRKDKCHNGYVHLKQKVKLCKNRACRDWADAASSISLRVPIEIQAQKDLGDLSL
jgi:hypothetical protein